MQVDSHEFFGAVLDKRKVFNFGSNIMYAIVAPMYS